MADPLVELFIKGIGSGQNGTANRKPVDAVQR
jgi:hypothetical protein